MRFYPVAWNAHATSTRDIFFAGSLVLVDRDGKSRSSGLMRRVYQSCFFSVVTAGWSALLPAPPFVLCVGADKAPRGFPIVAIPLMPAVFRLIRAPHVFVGRWVSDVKCNQLLLSVLVRRGAWSCGISHLMRSGEVCASCRTLVRALTPEKAEQCRDMKCLRKRCIFHLNSEEQESYQRPNDHMSRASVAGLQKLSTDSSAVDMLRSLALAQRQDSYDAKVRSAL